MADLNINVMVGEVSVTSTTKTFLTIKAPTNQRLKVLGFEITGKGTNNTDTPVKIEVGTINTDNTNGTSTPTLQCNDTDLTETPQGTYKTGYSSEPTYGNIMRTWEIQPQNGLIYMFPMGQEIKVGGGKEIGVKMTSTQAETMALNALVEE